MSDNVPNLGHAPAADAKRDAVHIAVYPGVAADTLYAGWEVGILSDGRLSRAMPAIGIVDPFRPLSEAVNEGERTWVFLYPKTVQNLRHVWSHPNIPDENAETKQAKTKAKMSDAEKWLRRYASRVNPYIECEEDAFNKMMSEAKTGEIYFYGDDCHSSADVDPEFFVQYEIYTGQRLDPDEMTYSCSC